MSEIASVVERTRRAFAAVSQLEAALARAPTDRAIMLNLSAMKKQAARSDERLRSFSQRAYIDVCDYRLLPEVDANHSYYTLSSISRSLLEFQNLFTQIYDAIKNGPKKNATFGQEAQAESALEFAYSYSGSLGVVLFSHSERDLISGKLDPAVDALYQVVEIKGRDEVRKVASNLGNAVVKRLYDWSDVNLKGGFAADVRWSRSDGHKLGEVIPRSKMEEIVGIIDATSDSKIDIVEAIGILFGGNIGSGSFHFVVPGGEVYRGYITDEFNRDTEMTLGKWYSARIRQTEKFHYATEKIERKHELLALNPASSLPLGQ